MLRRTLIDIFTEIAAVNSGQVESTEVTPSARWIQLRPFVTDAMGRRASRRQSSRDPRLEL